MAFAAAMGVALAFGEMAAFYIALSLIAGMAVLFDFRIGAVLLMVLLPMGATHLFPHALMGMPGLNPFNVVLAATLVSCAARAASSAGCRCKPLIWLYVVPILVAGLIGMGHANEILPYFYDSESINYFNEVGYFRERRSARC